MELILGNENYIICIYIYTCVKLCNIYYVLLWFYVALCYIMSLLQNGVGRFGRQYSMVVKVIDFGVK